MYQVANDTVSSRIAGRWVKLCLIWAWCYVIFMSLKLLVWMVRV